MTELELVLFVYELNINLFSVFSENFLRRVEGLYNVEEETVTREERDHILAELQERYGFGEDKHFGAETLYRYLEKNNKKIVKAVDMVTSGNFWYRRRMRKRRSLTYIYYKKRECNKGMLFAGVFREDFYKVLNRRIMEYIRKFEGITSWKGFIETSKVQDKEYLKTHPDAIYRWAEKEEIEGLVDKTWDAVYNALDKTGFYIREAEEYIQSRKFN